MVHQIFDDAGKPLDAHAEVDENGIDFQSRGPRRNTQYGPALRLLLRRIAASKLRLKGAWVDSARVQSLPREERLILSPSELDPSGERAFSLMSRRMAAVGSERQRGGGNPTKHIRIEFDHSVAIEEVERLLGLREVKATRRIPFGQLREAATPRHIFNAIEKLRDPAFAHPFGASTDYDLLTEIGERLPPKAVFGLAASEGLGREVGTGDFSSGDAIFRVLREAGYTVVPKGEAPEKVSIPQSNEDREWSEGKPRLVAHLKRERGHGLAQAKKDEFAARHGRLFCERCKMDPVIHFGSEAGLACIEVHHAAVHVSEMDDGHRTKLDDLQCLCANCHRVVHREMKAGINT